jgi:hypothetical protein
MMLSYLAFSKIWLNLPVNDQHFGYITKLIGKNPSLRHMSDFHDLVIQAHIFQRNNLYLSQLPFLSHQVGKICPKEIY